MIRNFWLILRTNFVKVFTTIIITFFLPRLLSIDSYAGIKTYQLYCSYIGLFHLGYCDSVFMKYGGNENYGDEPSKDFSGLLFFQLILTILFLIISIFKGDYIMLLWALSFIPTNVISFISQFYQANGQFKKYTKIINITTMLNLICNILLLFIFHIEKYEIYITFYVVILYLIFLYGILLFFKEEKLIFEGFNCFARIYHNSKLGFLLMIGNLSYVIFLGIDKWFVKLLYSTSNFADYSLACQLLTVINLITTPIGLTLFSYFKKNKSKQFESIVSKGLIIILLFMLSSSFGISFIIKLFITKYSNSIIPFSILIVSQLFATYNIVIIVNLFKTYAMQKVYIKNMVAIIVLSVVLNFVFNIFIGNIIAFSLATLVCMICWTFLNIQFFKYLIPDIRTVIYIILCMICYFILIFIHPIIAIFIYIFLFAFLTLLLQKKDIILFLKTVKL